MKTKPRAAFIIPTYNSEKYIRSCLNSIAKQTYPKKDFKIFIIDGGSTDKTVSIVNSYKKKLPIKILKNPARDAESGKKIGIDTSEEEFVILLDSDNEVTDKKWLETAIEVFDKNPNVWGVESPWLVNPKHNLLNQYFAELIVCDPVARMFSPSKKIVTDLDSYQLITVTTDDTPVTGANGFFWKKSLLKHNEHSSKFEETNYASVLVSKGHLTYARLKNMGVYHDYCSTVPAYIRKRIKIASKFLKRKENNQKTWVDRVGYSKFIFSIVYNATIIGPTIEAIMMVIRRKNVCWIYHPLISFITVSVYGFYFVKNKFAR